MSCALACAAARQMRALRYAKGPDGTRGFSAGRGKAMLPPPKDALPNGLVNKAADPTAVGAKSWACIAGSASVDSTVDSVESAAADAAAQPGIGGDADAGQSNAAREVPPPASSAESAVAEGRGALLSLPPGLGGRAVAAIRHVSVLQRGELQRVLLGQAQRGGARKGGGGGEGGGGGAAASEGGGGSARGGA